MESFFSIAVMHVLRVKQWCLKIFKNNNYSSSVFIIRYYPVNEKIHFIIIYIK